MSTYAWHPPLIKTPDYDLDENGLPWGEEFNRIMEQVSPSTTAEDFEDLIWESEPDDYDYRLARDPDEDDLD